MPQFDLQLHSRGELAAPTGNSDQLQSRDGESGASARVFGDAPLLVLAEVLCNMLVVRSIDTGVLIRFGARVQQLRKERGLSQGQFATRLAVHRPYLSGIECGTRSPTLKTISNIAAALAIDVPSLFQNAVSPPTRSGRILSRRVLGRRGRPLSATFGRRVQTVREGRGMSVVQLAMKVGFPRPYVVGVEHGIQNPSLLRISRFASALDVVLVELFQDV